MEYVPGTTLRRYCRADRLLPITQIVEIGFKCAMALGYVYRQGLIHRDVKPANLLTVLTNGTITDVKISDFGSVLNLDSDVTQVYRVGSLAYMSPEQLDGSGLDCRADMYSLGAVLYHLIAGRPPFDAQVQSAMMHQIYHGIPASLVTLRDGVGAAVDLVVQRALAKDPADRYADWDEFARALSGLIANPEVPRGHLQGVLDSEPRSAARTTAGRAPREVATLPDRTCPGEVEVFRDGDKVAVLGAGTSVGEMAYLAPSPDL
eukprot:gene19888-28157_t